VATDGVLVARIAAGDDEAICEVFDRYGPFVYGRNPERFDPSRGSLRAYLGVQAHRRSVDIVRSDARRLAREELHHDLDPNQGRTYGDEIDSQAVVEIVRQAIARLPAEQRQAVELAYLQGHTHRELARVLGIPEGTAKSRLRLAQAKLGEWLAPHMLEMA
jgi:RNA polymerase sigma-70 factor (ECF subfamily)